MNLHNRFVSANLFSIFIAMLLACGGTVNMPIAQQKEVDHKPAEMPVKPELPQKPRQPIKRNPDEKLVGGPGKPEVPQAPMWASPTKAVQLGDLQVQIIKISICKVPLKDLIRKETVSADELLMVKLDLLNTNPTKKLITKLGPENQYHLKGIMQPLKIILITSTNASDSALALNQSDQ